MPPLQVAFVGGEIGGWTVESSTAVAGDPLPASSRVAVVEGAASAPAGASWILRGVTSNARYVTQAELSALNEAEEPLGRPGARCAALIPIKKSDEWWDLAQDTRRRIFEDSSRHVETGLRYLPAIARRLHHCRDLGEPFDFLTWFEFSPAAAGAFDELVGILRATEEWGYVTREVDIRLTVVGRF